jgi:N-glycosylase/DNA lyase
LHYQSSWPQASINRSRQLVDCPTEHLDDTETLVRQYFNLDRSLIPMYEQWAAADSNFKKKAISFSGIRVLRQDPWEALIGFICSSNNNIARISQMVCIFLRGWNISSFTCELAEAAQVQKLCVNFGSFLGYVDQVPYYEFPSPKDLAVVGAEALMRELGFGYRAKYLASTAEIVAERPIDWLHTISNPFITGKALNATETLATDGRDGYKAAHQQLLQLQGVGPKVADCVCLMGLGWEEAVPVDTHVWQIAVRDYKFGKGKHRSLTKENYQAVGDHFRKLWGLEAGWAHSVLFAADLKSLSAAEGSQKRQLGDEDSQITKGDLQAVLESSASKGNRKEGLVQTETTGLEKEIEVTSVVAKRRRVQR